MNPMMNFRFPLAAAMLAAMSAAGCHSGRAGDRELALGEAPAAVQQTVTREAAGAKIEDFKSIVEDGKTLYVAEFIRDGKPTEVEVYADGVICCIETELAPAELPAAVREAAQRGTAGLTITEVERKLSKGVVTFLVEAEGGGREVSMELAGDGRVISRNESK